MVNNAGVIRDKSFGKLTDKMFDIVIKVHVYGTYAMTKAVWPHFRKQRYGRILNIVSGSGLWGNFG